MEEIKDFTQDKTHILRDELKKDINPKDYLMNDCTLLNHTFTTLRKIHPQKNQLLIADPISNLGKDSNSVPIMKDF